METKLPQALIGAFLAILFGTQAVANSQIKEDFAYAFGSSAGLDTGSIRLLSPSEMDETEGLFIGWLLRMGPRAYRGLIEAFRIVGVEFRNARKDGIKRNAWLRYGNSWSTERGFVTRSIRWGSTSRHANKKVKNLVLRAFNKRLYETKIPINSWRTNQPGHLHLWKAKKNPSAPQSRGEGGASSSFLSSAAANPENYDSSSDNRDGGPVVSPDLHDGSGGVISSIDWETITAEELLSGRYTEALLTDAATGPTGSGRNAERWKMEDLTEKQVVLGLSILLFVSDPENNVGIDIPWMEVLEDYFAMEIYLRKNPRRNGRAAKLAKLGLDHLRYIIGQHSQGYHAPEDGSEEGASDHDATSDASAAPDALNVDSPTAPQTPPDRNTYLPINAHWWMHDFNAR